MQSCHVLVVDDEASHRDSLMRMLQRAGYVVEVAADGDVALAHLQRTFFDVVLCDLVMPRTDGMGVLRAAKRLHPHTHVVLMTAYGTVENAVQAMRGGASDFITKPARRAELLGCIERVRGPSASSMSDNDQASVSNPTTKPNPAAVVGADPSFCTMLERAQQLLRAGAPLVVAGEPGAGKAHVARACLPSASIVVEAAHLASWPSDEAAAILIRHVEHLPSALWPTLQHTLRSDGPRRPVVMTTHLSARDLQQRFGPELGSRMAHFTLEIPPLRMRTADIGLLVQHFAALVCVAHNRTEAVFDEDAVACLSSYTYPDNVRELALAVERAVLWSSGARVRVDDLPSTMRTLPPPTVVLRVGEMALDAFERRAIEATLAYAQGDKVLAAKLLGLSLRTLYRRIDTPTAEDD
jgi:DNA-binding NtrC family response regulator